MVRKRLLRRAFTLAVLLLLSGVPGWRPIGQAQASRPAPHDSEPQSATALASGTITSTLLFVTQVPIPMDFTTIGSVFGNQRGDMDSTGRGGDLYIRYPDGTLKNLTAAAGYGHTGFQDSAGIAVRDPAVHWSGTKAIFSMVMGAPQRYQWADYYWQMYEITSLGQNETPVITKVPNQPANFNNIQPIYGTDDRIIFVTDRPRNGQSQLYPQLDEYEEAPTPTGLWSLDPTTGDLFMMDHVPSGAFTPFLDSFGRVIFTRWDHLQRDQQADTDALHGNPSDGYKLFNYADESANAARLNTQAEVFPEPRGARTDLLAGTNMEGHSFNVFFPWMINEDGTREETLNHIGRHELAGYFDRSFNDDSNLHTFNGTSPGRANPNNINNFLQIREDLSHPGTYYGIDAPEFFTHAAGQVISMTGAPGINPDQMVVKYVTHRETSSFVDVGQTPSANNSGHYRNPVVLSNGTIVVAHTAETHQSGNLGTRANPIPRYDFRLKTLAPQGNIWVAGGPLTTGISKTISYYDPDVLVSYSGNLWELEPVEVIARPRPARQTPTLEAPEQQVMDEEGVDVAALQSYLRANNLALVISRNVTTRDRNDKQQPYNLRVTGGLTQTLGTGGKIYDIAYMQFFQADQIRGMGGVTNPRPGRRVLAQIMHDPAVQNPPHPAGPAGSVKIAADGSVAAFVPARRAMTWQTTDAAGTAVVRERYWLTFQPGEIRACASCHGVNTLDQAGHPPATNKPEALRQILQFWKGQVCPTSSADVDADSHTDVRDLMLVAKAIGNPTAPSSYDMDCSGAVTIADVTRVAAQWHQ
ncbi:MAG: hypothetical protein EXR62_15730 [Chloroflexi bacterium]|nr:hypothetical protein [Chloroflexota bacterium]